MIIDEFNCRNLILLRYGDNIPSASCCFFCASESIKGFNIMLLHIDSILCRILFALMNDGYLLLIKSKPRPPFPPNDGIDGI